MAMFYVEKQPWQRWPKVLTVCRNGEDGIERRRYVPERTCRVEYVWDMTDEYEYAPHVYYTVGLTCGHSFEQGDSEPPSFCPECGRKVEY